MTAPLPESKTTKMIRGRFKGVKFDELSNCVASLRELMRSASADYQKEAQEHGWPLPGEELNDPRCNYL
jgi:hypothetical protein